MTEEDMKLLTDCGVFTEHAPITREAELELVSAFIAGEEYAATELLVQFSGLIWSICKDYINSFNDNQISDIFLAGVSGFYEKLAIFDVNANTRISTFCTYGIHCAIKNYLATNETVISLTTHERDLQKKYHAFVNRIESETGNAPTDEMICSELNINTKKLGKIRSVAELTKVTCFESLLDSEDEESDRTLDEKIPASICDIQEGCEFDDFIRKLPGLLSGLKDRDRDILERSFGLNREAESSKQIAMVYNISSQRVLQIVDKSLEQIGNDYYVNNIA